MRFTFSPSGKISAVAQQIQLHRTHAHVHLEPVWQGSGSSKNCSGSGSSGGVASLVELSRFKKHLAK
jgi:hypothetical protein